MSTAPMDIVLLFPGQGSQRPGMGQDLASAFPAARAVFQEIDAALNAPLSALCFSGPADELTLTHNAQPALLAHGAAVWAVVRERLRPFVRAAAGHSLGEHTAYHAAGTLGAADAARLVRRRGELMYEVGTARPGTMAAILGQTGTPVDVLCAQASQDAGVVVPANYNSDEQTVVSGEIPGVERVMELAKAAGAKRALRLPVSGAFHSPLMAPAEPRFQDAVDAAPLRDPAFPVYSNVTEHPCTSVDAARDVLVRQLTAPVRWAGLIRNLAARYPSALFVEMGPGAVLTGLMPRIVPGVQSMACGTPADVDKLLAKVS